MYEWLPLLLGKTAADMEYKGYQPSIAPYVDSLYAAVASKWYMTLVPPAIALRSVKLNKVFIYITTAHYIFMYVIVCSCMSLCVVMCSCV